jgi:hypothetical protein
MKKKTDTAGRRNFLRTATTLVTSIAGLTVIPQNAAGIDVAGHVDDIHIIGPKEGFSPQIGTLVSMMNWMRATVLRSIEGLNTDDLDYLHDGKSNSIGAMLLHLAATEMYYKANTFEGRNSFNDEESKKFGAAMSLGDAGRKEIRSHNLKYYLAILEETRNNTIQEFKRRDDKWLMEVDPSFFGRQPTNNYCKWFHVCEHESNHNGQIKWIKSRLPGAKSSTD